MHDANQNGKFDDFPDGIVDPFGWKNPYNTDPWAVYRWSDLAGSHTGAISNYLWKQNVTTQIAYINGDWQLSQNNKTITFNVNENENPYTALLMEFIKPNIPFSQFNLDYIEGTSFTLTALDHQEKPRVSLDSSVKLTVDLNQS